MIKVYSQEKPAIVMEGTNTPEYISWDLEAFDDGGKISIRRTNHAWRVIAWKVAHTDFVDENWVPFWDLQQTIDSLNIIYNSPWNIYNKDEINDRFWNTSRDFVMDIDNIFLN